MTLLFPDVNVWLALSDAGHRHNLEAWSWLNSLPRDSRLVFSRFTQIGLLRLLTNNSVMGTQTLELRKAWGVYDQWLADPRVEFYPEPRDIDVFFRRTSEPFASRRASNAVGDCWILAFAKGLNATLITFDRSLCELAGKQGHPAVIPS